MKKVLQTTILLFFVKISFTQINVQWETRYTGTGNNPDNVSDMYVDASGNIYVTGSSYNSASGYDIITRKYNNSGAVLWTATFNGSGNGTDVANALAVDGLGNVFVTGYSFRGGSNFDITTIKYTSAGAQSWQNYSGNGTSAFDEGKDIVVDSNNDIIVVGGIQNTAGSNTDYRTIKYTNAGGVSWTADYSNTTNLDIALAVALDPSNNVYVTGHSFVTNEDLNIRTIKYNGATGAISYNTATNFSTINSIDSPSSIAVNSAGEAFVAGRVFNGSFFDDDIVVLKYSAAGAVTNSLIINGTANSTDKANRIYLDASNNVYLAGRVKNTGTSEDFYLAKFNSTLGLIWSDSYNGPSNNYDEATDIVIDGSGNVYVSGSSFTTGSNFDFVTAKYTSAGTRTWLTKFNGTANNVDKSKRIAVDATGNVYVSGDSKGTGTGDDFSTIKYCQLTTDAGPDVSICTGSTTPLTVTGGSTISWQASPSLSCTNCPNPTANPTTTTTYIVSTTDGNNCTDYDTVQVTVNPLPGPTITATGPTQFCAPGSVTLIASGFSSYLWSTTSTNDSITVNSSGTYTVTVTDAMGCQNSTNQLVTVFSLPNVDAGSAVPYCEGEGTFLFASGATTYQWSPTTDLDDDQIPNPFVNTNTTGYYYVTGTDGNGCSNIDSVLITVNPTPAQPLVTYIAASNHFIVSSTYNTGIQWYYNGNPMPAPDGNAEFFNADSNGVYWMVYTDPNGCSTINSDTITVSGISYIGVDELSKIYGVEIYPNPNNGFFNLNIENNFGFGLVTILDLTGKVIIEETLINNQNKRFDISNLSNGLYLMRLQIDDYQSAYRIIKQ